MLEQAIRNGEVRGNIDLEVALDLLYDPLFFRLLMGHMELDESFMDRVLDLAVNGMRRSDSH